MGMGGHTKPRPLYPREGRGTHCKLKDCKSEKCNTLGFCRQHGNIFTSTSKILDLIKISVKAMNRVGKGFDYVRQTFPCKNYAKIKEGIFVGRQIKQLFKTPTSKIN
jgi:hypothetical protein